MWTSIFCFSFIIIDDLSSILGVSDPNNPFNNNARPNSWTPPLNTSWTWGTDHVYGYAILNSHYSATHVQSVNQNRVNLGGLFVLEPFVTPYLFDKYPGAVDEWSLSTLMAADTSPGGGLGQIENHYKTFIVSISSVSSLPLRYHCVTDRARYSTDRRCGS